MATFKVTGGIAHFKDRLINGMIGRHYSREYAEHTVSQIEGFGSYGFPGSHAASFTLIAYAFSRRSIVFNRSLVMSLLG